MWTSAYPKKDKLQREINLRTNTTESRSKIKQWNYTNKLLNVDVMQHRTMSESCTAAEGVACVLTAE